MGTRSACGFRHNGRDVLAYNQYDGYPEGVGDRIVREIRDWVHASGSLSAALEDWRTLAEDVKIVSPDDPVTPKAIESLQDYADTGVSTESLEDWYCLTRKLHGLVLGRLETGYFVDQTSFVQDSLFCEWAYCLNLDNETFEVYQCFQNEPHDRGRFSYLPKERETVSYWPCALVTSIPLTEILDENFVLIAYLAPYLPAENE